MKAFYYETTQVWKLSRKLVLLTYELTKDYPKHELFGLVSQMRRASVSVSSNIVEGFSRQSGIEQARFTEIAYGSLMELLCQSTLSFDLSYISKENYANARILIEELSNKLNSLRKTQLKR